MSNLAVIERQDHTQVVVGSDEMFDRIIAVLAGSTASLHDVLAGIDGAPSKSHFMMDWLCDADRKARYDRAKQVRAELLVDEMLEIADSEIGDAELVYDQNGKPRAKMSGKNIRRAEVQIATRKWLAAKFNPRSYGDQLDVTSNGQTVTNNITHNHVTIDQRVQTIMTLAARRRDEVEAAARDMLDD
jgi:hypothetical protein